MTDELVVAIVGSGEADDVGGWSAHLVRLVAERIGKVSEVLGKTSERSGGSDFAEAKVAIQAA